MTKRAIFFLLAFGLVLGGAIAAARPALAITTVFDEHVLKRDEVIRLSDLFEGLERDADRAIAPAPAPGERVVYDISRLAAVARAHDIDWRPRTWTDRVVIERQSQKLGPDAIETALLAEIKRRGKTNKVEVEVASTGAQLHLPTGVAPTVAVQQFDLDERSGRFSAVIAAPAESPTHRTSVQGRIHDIIDVPVLARRLNTGEIIRKDDIDWIALRADRTNRAIVTDAESLIGREVRRGVLPGQPLRSSDVRAPMIVGKGSIVTMVLQTPKMQLTSKGRAMENASMGETVRIMNTQSKTVIEAIVIGANTVQVVPVTAMQY